MQNLRDQAITGVVSPQLGEAVIREVFPSIAMRPVVAGLGRRLTRTIIGAPLAWLVMALFYFLKVAPFLAFRYTLTNRRLMVRRGLKPSPTFEVPLTEIDDVRVQRDANSDFFRAANLEIISEGKILITLKGVPEPESFRHSILDATKAWVPGKATGPWIPAKAPA
ncbi:MAG TPA: PH domain-containing protein [Gemmataceae bacterium]|nr:PH domain-containing protein [Gemmataceae bacterium]